jgi:hypothetical protein
MLIAILIIQVLTLCGVIYLFYQRLRENKNINNLKPAKVPPPEPPPPETDAVRVAPISIENWANLDKLEWCAQGIEHLISLKTKRTRRSNN